VGEIAGKRDKMNNLISSGFPPILRAVFSFLLMMKNIFYLLLEDANTPDKFSCDAPECTGAT
jgi:hypothetical protein